MNIPADFIEKPVVKSTAPWCVDGRPDYEDVKGAQMLGASLHPVLLWCIYNKQPLTQESISVCFKKLTEAGFGLGVHCGENEDGEQNKSDCGFADNLSVILELLRNQEEDFEAKLINIYHEHIAEMNIEEAPFHESIQEFYRSVEEFAVDKTPITGRALIDLCGAEGAYVERVNGQHQEVVAFVNQKRDVSLDILEENKAGKQAFNLDLWMVLEQTKALGVPEMAAIAASLLLYLATEVVLVEQKGKPALPIATH